MRMLFDSAHSRTPTRVARKVLLLAAAVLVALGTASTASAANAMPNPGFEDATCSPSPMRPCYWPEIFDATGNAYRDTSTLAHNGDASYRLEVSSPTQSVLGVASQCIPASLAGGVTPVSFWYRTMDTDVNIVSLDVHSFPGLACGGLPSVGNASVVAVVTGTWQNVTGTVSIAAGASFNLVLGLECFDACNQNAALSDRSDRTAGTPVVVAVNFDDLSVEQTPTAVRLSSLSATRTRAGLVLRWKTAQESSLLGFNVYRQRHGKLVKLNRTLIPSVFGGTASGQSYLWLDRHAPTRGSLRYRLQAVDLNGTRSWLGSASAS